jgi:predicted lipid-binding transport protein (Tim44 family)
MMTDDDLEGLFSAARGAQAQPSPDLLARVLADAQSVQTTPAPAPARAKAPRGGLWSALVAVFGGSGALAGMATAMVAGLYLGFAQPMGDGLLATVLGGDTATMDMMPGIDALLEEAP